MNPWQQRANELAHENEVNTRLLRHKMERVRASCAHFLHNWSQVNDKIEQQPALVRQAVEVCAKNADAPPLQDVLPEITKIAEEIRSVSVSEKPSLSAEAQYSQTRPMIRV